MAKKKKKRWFILGFLFFLIYIFAAVQPIPEETILAPRWLSSLESNFPIIIDPSIFEEELRIPFQLGTRFGYVEDNGYFILNRILQEGYLSFSPYNWSEYEALPSSIDVFDPQGRLLKTINNPQGYPLFLDNRTFILGNEQNSLSALNDRSEIIWTYDFPAPLTCVDASSGFVLAGTLDGSIELLNAFGEQVFPPFEPGGSRLAVILGCAISKDGSRLAIISGIDDQRFLLMERSGDTYRVVYHEFLSTGFRRAVHVSFIDNDSRVVFEREGGIGIYDTASRTTVTIALEGAVTALDSGDNNYLFLISTQEDTIRNLVGIKLPGKIFLNAPFRSENVFLDRRGSKIFLGGDMSLISFVLGKH